MFKGDHWIRGGVWIWAVSTIVIVGFCLFIVVRGGLHYHVAPDKPGACEIVDAWQGMYLALKDNNTLLGGILAFTGLAWAKFFVASLKQPSNDGV